MFNSIKFWEVTAPNVLLVRGASILRACLVLALFLPYFFQNLASPITEKLPLFLAHYSHFPLLSWPPFSRKGRTVQREFFLSPYPVSFLTILPWSNLLAHLGTCLFLGMNIYHFWRAWYVPGPVLMTLFSNGDNNHNI